MKCCFYSFSLCPENEAVPKMKLPPVQYKGCLEKKNREPVAVPAGASAAHPRPGSPMEREKNPFHVPADEEVFALRDEEAARKRAEREKAKELHVWEKGVKKNPSAALLASEPGLQEANALQQSKLNLVAAATRDRRKEKEHMGEFIAKKREMFLVQMSLDTKRAEIRKLEERAQQREEALRKSEQMLEEDALRFDQFLKDNDQKAVQAIKKAEAETKAKAEKVQEIKKLNMHITQIKVRAEAHTPGLITALVTTRYTVHGAGGSVVSPKPFTHRMMHAV